MDTSEGGRRHEAGTGRLATLMGVFGLVGVGFFFGILAGAVFEEPRLVLDHVSGNSTEVDLATLEAAPDPGLSLPGRPLEPAPLGAPRGDGAVETAAAPPAAPLREAVPAPVRPRPGPAPPAVSAPPPGFVIQVGAFAEEAAAERLAGALRGDGYPIRLSRADGKTRVRVGPYPSRAEAERHSKTLKTAHRLPTWIQSEGGG